jgi:hypothetical protein
MQEQIASFDKVVQTVVIELVVGRAHIHSVLRIHSLVGLLLQTVYSSKFAESLE